MRTAFRIAARDLRGGLRGFRIFLACLTLGVAAIAAVGSVRQAVQTGLEEEGAVILGGDAEMTFVYRMATEEEAAWMAARALAVSETVDFRSMAVAEVDSETVRGLTQLRGVDGRYPLYGEVGLDPAMTITEALATTDLPGAVMHPTLIAQMGLQIGDRVTFGVQEFELRAALTHEPDMAGGNFGPGPRTLVRLDALEGSGLLGPGTLYNSQYRLALPEGTDLETLETEARDLFADSGMLWKDSRNAAPALGRFVERIGAFLVLVGLAGLAVGGVGISAAVRSYLTGKTETIATLKTLGAERRLIFTVYLLQIGAMTLLGLVFGLVLGAVLPLGLAPLIAGALPVPADFGFHPAPLAEAALYGALTALIFTLWPLARVEQVRAAALYRETAGLARLWPRWPFLLIIAGLAAALIALSAWLSGIPRLAFWSAAAILSAMIILVLAASLVRLIARHAARHTRGHPALRMALGSIGAPGSEASSTILSLGLGLSVLAAVGQVDTNLRAAIQQDLPEVAPAFFFVDIQPDQIAPFLTAMDTDPDVTRVDSAPMLRGVITRINDRPAAEIAGNHWVIRGDRGLTYRADAPPAREITDGAWWPEDYDGPPQMAFAAEEALEMGIGLGDRMTVNVLGRDITATIVALREVDFSNAGIGFVMTLSPNALAGAPHTHIATVYADQQAEADILREVAAIGPNITAISVRDAIDQVARALSGIAAATSWGAAATLLTGFMVLIGAAAAGERARAYEAAVLKTLGASRARILGSFALRSALLGMAAGAVAVAAGGLAGWAVTRFVMETDFAFNLPSALAITLGGALATLLAGLAFALRPLAIRPAAILRSEG
ncbi:ABC transporter permease [Nioella sediminis]|jgi:putative ABC transport system permease protein|uniref:ABC transporter permease n=1 Tax=Nioella sediminis TaxID=1912092 RepID=UPI0008FD77E3|nr:FtsX-like permease family protein [Nioella sediminis]TBX28703.1 drug:proton antiporter [Roseovarius sp. JS7-11]